MKEIARFIKKLRGLDHVGRWEFHPHLKYESVSQHSYWVAVFTSILANTIDRPTLVVAALMHDAEEAITADLPALVKARVPCWDDVVQKADAELFQASVGGEEREIQDALVAARFASSSTVIKLADLFSALMYARMEIELGNTHFKRIERELIYGVWNAASKEGLDPAVAARAKYLLEALGFDHTEGLERPAEISHL